MNIADLGITSGTEVLTTAPESTIALGVRDVEQSGIGPTFFGERARRGRRGCSVSSAKVTVAGVVKRRRFLGQTRSKALAHGTTLQFLLFFRPLRSQTMAENEVSAPLDTKEGG